jgi:hypothetical protein
MITNVLFLSEKFVNKKNDNQLLKRLRFLNFTITNSFKINF